jgi:hypothetical protein
VCSRSSRFLEGLAALNQARMGPFGPLPYGSFRPREGPPAGTRSLDATSPKGKFLKVGPGGVLDKLFLRRYGTQFV